MGKTETIKFSISTSGINRLGRLVTTIGGGDKSIFLHRAIELLERVELFQRLRKSQAYGAERLVSAGYSLNDIPKIVAEACARLRDGVVDERVKEIVARIVADHGYVATYTETSDDDRLLEAFKKPLESGGAADTH